MQVKPVSNANKNQAIKEAVCDGGAGALGHPKVYLPFGEKEAVTCYYCGKKFEKN